MLTHNEKKIVKAKLQIVMNHMEEAKQLAEDIKETCKDVQNTHGIKASVFKKLAKLMSDTDKRNQYIDENRMFEALLDDLKDVSDTEVDE